MPWCSTVPQTRLCNKTEFGLENAKTKLTVIVKSQEATQIAAEVSNFLDT